MNGNTVGSERPRRGSRAGFFSEEFEMIDLHAHLLPGVDDGATDLEQALAMGTIAAEDGITCVAATPHSYDGQHGNTPDRITTAVAALNREFANRGIGLNVVCGMEVPLTAEVPKLLKEERLLTLNRGRYLLVEFYRSQIPAGAETLIEALIESNVGVIIAHPEKNAVLQRHPEFLYNLLQRVKPWDVLFQVSADSITGEAGFWARRTVKMLLKAQLVHLVSSDAHSATIRAPRLSAAVAEVSRILDGDRARQMVLDVPRAVLGHGPFPPAWEPQDPRRWWRVL
jgi:protein-tyrosine phosphatase